MLLSEHYSMLVLPHPSFACLLRWGVFHLSLQICPTFDLRIPASHYRCLACKIGQLAHMNQGVLLLHSCSILGCQAACSCLPFSHHFLILIKIYCFIFFLCRVPWLGHPPIIAGLWGGMGKIAASMICCAFWLFGGSMLALGQHQWTELATAFFIKGRPTQKKHPPK